jgi:HD-GYP domain-containing protein (c-di-GMP phosphodiesterase class II)
MAHTCYFRGMASEGRLAEVLGALSLAADLAYGLPLEKTIRTCVLGVELGRRHGLSDEVLRDGYYAILMASFGCTAFAHDAAQLAHGDDIAMNRALVNLDSDPFPGRVPRFLRQLGRGVPFFERVRGMARFAARADGAAKKHGHAVCDVAVHLARLVGASSSVRTALSQMCENWDGSGEPNGAAGDAIELPGRLERISFFTDAAYQRDGRDAAVALLKKQAGRHFDPSLAKTFIRDADELFALIDGNSIWDLYLFSEPRPHAQLDEARLNDVAKAFAQIADVKSVWTLGHSTGVAELATRAATELDITGHELSTLRRAALLHDLGRVSAPNRVWDKPATLSRSEWEAVRMHTYWTERILAQSPLLRDAAQVASAAHERPDGGGYHRGMPSAMLCRTARVLAAADAYHAMGEPRAHRPALCAADSAKNLLEDVARGRVDRRAAEAVLDAAGVARSRARAAWPRGLTDREVEVLLLVARGQSNKEIASNLGISPRTAQQHVIHIYQKIDVSSRAAAALFAVEQDLLSL